MASNTIGIEIDVDSSGAVRGMRQLGQAGDRAGNQISQGTQQASRGIGGMLRQLPLVKIGIAGVALAAANMAKNFIKLGLATAKEAEKIQVQFKTILGSAEAAQERYAELANFAATTPFQLDGVAKASKILETLTQGTLSTGDGLKLVGDAAAIAGVNFDELAVTVGRAYSGLQANQKIGEPLARLQELGVISAQTKTKVNTLLEAAKGKEAWKVLQTELEKTKGGMEALSDTIAGKESTLADNFGILAAQVVKATGIQDAYERSLDGTLAVVNSLNASLQLAAIAQKNVNDLTITEVDVLKKSNNLKIEANKIGTVSGFISSQHAARLRSVGFSYQEVAKAEAIYIKGLKEENNLLDKVITKRKSEKAHANVAAKFAAKATADAEIKAKAEEESLRIEEEGFKKRANVLLSQEELRKQRARDRITQRQEDLDFEKDMAEQFRELDQQQAMKKLEFGKKQSESKKRRSKEDLLLEQRTNMAILSSSASLANNLLGLQQAAFGRNKTASIAQAIINTSVGVTRAYHQGGTLGFITGAAIAAAGAAQVATINKQKFANGGIITGSGTNRSDSIPIMASSGESILNQPATQRLGAQGVNSLNNGGSLGNTFNINVTAGAGADGAGIAQVVANALKEIADTGIEPQVI